LILKYKCKKCNYNLELESENKFIIICPSCSKKLKPKRLIFDEFNIPKIKNTTETNKIINIIMIILVSFTGISLFFNYDIMFKLIFGSIILSSCILEIICRD